MGGVKGSVNGVDSVGILGGSTGINAPLTLAAGYQSTVTDTGVTSTPITEEGAEKFQEEGTHPGLIVGSNDPDNLSFKILDHFATAVGYQATADEAQTVAFGHDKGDTYYGTTTYTWKQKATIKDGHYYDEYGSEINEDDYKSLMNADGTWNDYSQPIATVEEKKYNSAYYNRLVKAADGIEDHDAVVMEQLKNASDVGSHIKVYKTDTNGNVQFDENNKPIEDTSEAVKTKREAAQKASEDAWGEAIGTGKVEANNSQLVTGDTVYNAIQNQAEWKLTTNGESADKAAAIKPGTTVNFSAEKNGKDHSNVTISHNGSNVTIGLDKDIVLGDTSHSSGGSLNVYTDSSDSNNLSNHVSINGSTISVNYPKSNDDKTDTRGVILGVGEEDSKPDGYIAFNNVEGGYTYLHASTDASDDKKGRLEYVGSDRNKKYIANLDDVSTAVNNAKTKYYAVDENAPLMNLDTYKNEGNDGAKGMGSLAAGFVTHADGIASTVAGSYSGVIGSGLQGAAAVSVGTVNVNNNTDPNKIFSGVANSVVGQANMTTNSNAAIIYGAGNTVTDSYRPINDKKAAGILGSISDPTKLSEAMQNAVKDSGGQVMVMGGGNTVDKAYMTQVTGVGNTVTGADSTYAEGTSTQYNFVDGFQNELTNGKHDYIIGSNNTVSGDSTDTNQSNIIFGDNHKLTDQKNNVIIGSSDTDDETTASDVVAIGHNAKVSAKGGVAIGSGSVATVAGKTTEGYNPATGQNSTETTSTWQATNAAVSIGTADGKVTRQINGVAAGTNDTDAVNVAQLKNATAGMTTKGLNFQGNNTAVTVHRDLGSTLTIKGNGTKDDSSYSADNIKVVGDANGSLTIMMDKEIKGDRITVGEKGEPGKEGQAGKDGVDGQIGVNGKDGSAVVINGKDGSIGLNGKDGANGLTIKGAKGDAGVDGTDGHDGKDGMTRIVYEDHNKVTHKVATLDDGMKYAGDFGDGAAVKLDKTVNIKGNVKEGAKSDDFVDGNIAVVANKTGDNGELQIKLNKNLTGLNSATYTTTTGEGESAKTSTTTVDGNGLTIMNGPSITNNGVDAGKKAITNVGNGIEKDSAGKYTVTDQNKGNAANIGDVQNMVNEAVNSAADTTNGALAGKANVDASNIGANLKGEDAEKTTNENAWGSAIGTGKIEKDNGQLVTGKTVYDEVRPKEDGNYVKTNQTTGENLSALDSKIGKLDETKKYNYIDSGKDVSISNNLTKLDTQVKNNADAIKENSKSIQDITNNVKNLSDNAVQYDEDSNKSKVTLAGEGGTTITNVKDGVLSENSSDAVNGKQLYAEQQAREKADAEINQKVTNNTNEITKIKNGDFTDASKTAIHNIAKNAVKVVDGKNTTVTEVDGTDTTPTTYAVNVEGKGKVDSGDTGLISGDTLYKEVHVDKDGAYIKGSNTVGQNLSTLDTGLKTTSDLIHTNAKGDTIQIGGNSTATKIDISGKDKNGKSTGRVITGVVSDVSDPNSAANVGYVNGITSASNEQIYHDMNMQYNHVENDISRAAAGSNALAALHPMQEFDPDDKAQFALGYGHYRNSNAGAVGAFYQPDENSMVNFGVSFGNGDAGINAGVTFKFGPGGSGHHALTKTQMAKVIDAQSKEIDELKKDNADKDKRIDALEQKMTEILAKLDKSKD